MNSTFYEFINLKDHCIDEQPYERFFISEKNG